MVDSGSGSIKVENDDGSWKSFKSSKELFKYLDSLPPPTFIKRLGYKLDNLRRDIPRTIKFFFQRIFRGFDDSEIWNLDYTVAKFMLPRFQEYRKDNPFFWYDEEKYPEEWRFDCGELTRTEEERKQFEKEADEYKEYIFNEIEWFLKQSIDEDHDQYFTDDEFDKEKFEQYNKRYDKACIIFGKYFRRLWN